MVDDLEQVRTSECDVLIVEDEPLAATEIAESLSRAGLRVRIAYDAASAVSQTIACPPKVALIDCNLPNSNGVSGFLVAKEFEGISPRTAVIFMSGHIEGVAEPLLEATKARAFINKPLPFGFLQVAIRKLLRDMELGLDHAPEKKGWMLSGLGFPGDMGRKGSPS